MSLVLEHPVSIPLNSVMFINRAVFVLLTLKRKNNVKNQTRSFDALFNLQNKKPQPKLKKQNRAKNMNQCFVANFLLLFNYWKKWRQNPQPNQTKSPFHFKLKTTYFIFKFWPKTLTFSDVACYNFDIAKTRKCLSKARFSE